MKTVYTTLSLLLLFSAAMSVDAKTKTFFFAGQSNMEGYTEDDELDLPKIVDRLMNDESKLLPYLKGAKLVSPETPDKVYELQATELVALRNRGVITADFSQPLSARCSFHQLMNDIDYRKDKAAKPDVLANNVNITPVAACGIDYGPELGFGHVMENFYNEPLSVFKLASGGSTLKQNWSKRDGSFWPVVAKQLSALNNEKEEWAGIVYFQGENDAFDAFQQNSAKTYLEDLTKFITDLRNEMYNADTTAFASAEDIPVAIVQVGCWIRTLPDDNGPLISQSQAGFVAAQEKYYASVGKPSKTALVFTGDLSCYYHFDKASHIIIGARVADAMRQILTSQPTQMTPAPTPSPTKAVITTKAPAMTSAPTGVVLDPTPSPVTLSPSKSPIVASAPTVAPDLGNPTQGALFVNLVIKLDNFPEETSWSFKETNARNKLHWVDPEVYTGREHVTITQKLWVDPIDMTYTFTMFDTFGDGLMEGPGYFELTHANGDLIVRVDDFNDFETEVTFSMTSTGINHPPAVTQSPAAAPPDDESVLAPTEQDSYVVLAIQLDEFPEEISWRLVESDTQKLLHWVEPDAYGDQFGQLAVKTLWLKPSSTVKSYELIMMDTFGDGLIDNGYFELTRGNGQQIARVDDFSTGERIVRFQMTN